MTFTVFTVKYEINYLNERFKNPKGRVLLSGDALHIVYTQNKVEHYLRAVYQEDLKLCLSGGVSGEVSVINKAPPSC